MTIEVAREMLASADDAGLDDPRVRVLAQAVIDVHEANDRAAKSLVRAVWLYPNYRTDSRGPRGCIYDALKEISPGVVGTIDSLSGAGGDVWGAAHFVHWPEDDQ